MIFCMSALDTLGIVCFTVGVGETENPKNLLARVRGPGIFFGPRRVSGWGRRNASFLLKNHR